MQTLLPWARWIGALTIWPLDLACSLLHRQALAWRTMMAVGAPAMGLSWPFDLARAQHAAGVESGLLERSLLASAAFERRLGRLEHLMLGPLARRV